MNKNIPLLLLLACTSLLEGCAFSTAMRLPDGSEGYRISCNGTASSYGVCFQKAGEICGTKGYSVLDRDGSAIPFGSFNMNQYGANATSGVSVSRYIMMKCNEPK